VVYELKNDAVAHHIDRYVWGMRWGKFSQKYNYKYMAKWWCLL